MRSTLSPVSSEERRRSGVNGIEPTSCCDIVDADRMLFPQSWPSLATGNASGRHRRSTIFVTATPVSSPKIGPLELCKTNVHEIRMLCIDGLCNHKVQRPSIQSIWLLWTFSHVRIWGLQVSNLHQIKGEMGFYFASFRDTVTARHVESCSKMVMPKAQGDCVS